MIAEALRRCSPRDLDTFARFADAADPAVASYWRALVAWERSRRAAWAAAAMDGAGWVPMPSCPAEARRDAVHAAAEVADAFLRIAKTDTRMLGVFHALAHAPEPTQPSPKAAAESAFGGLQQ